MTAPEFILKRHAGNPIITPADFPGAKAVFNPGQTTFEGKTILLLSVIHNTWKHMGRPIRSSTHVAESADGVRFEIRHEPFIEKSEQLPYCDIGDNPIDLRVTKINDVYYIIHPCSGPWGTFAVLGKTTDFKTHENVDVISLPDNRLPCLFPERIGGQYVRIDRPYRVAPNDFHNYGHLWLSYSPDLIHWGRHRPLLKTGWAPWARTKIGPTPPIKTAAGWLVVIHGVAPSCGGHRYALGAVLLDLENPQQIVGKTYGAILEPYEPYELTGIVPNVVFTCGAIADEAADEIRVYYGCADTSVGLASGSLGELIEACRHEW
ncbi:MAG: glycoside hydrolase family 130 protein [Kiritimatiellae bacterium]|nr:glycoside hydrolase family 130 protein [Kiritimatiellia bacterium]